MRASTSSHPRQARPSKRGRVAQEPASGGAKPASTRPHARLSLSNVKRANEPSNGAHGTETAAPAEVGGAQVAETGGLLCPSPPPSARQRDQGRESKTASVGPASLEDQAWFRERYGRQCRQQPREAALRFLSRRLQQPRSREARTLELRPALREVTASLSSCFRAAVELGHGTSALVVGSRGSGKTLAVEQALAQLLREHNGGAADARVGVVRLHGWAHADERLAFREAARQLCRQAVVVGGMLVWNQSDGALCIPILDRWQYN